MRTNLLKRYSNKFITRIILVILFTVILSSVGASTADAAPEMYVYDIYYPTSLVALQATTVSVELYNYGDAGYFNLYIYVDGEWVNSSQYQFYTQYGAGYTVSFNFPSGYFTAGQHTIEFYTDHGNLGGTWTWTGTPDLQLTDIYQPSSTVGGQNSTLTAKINNVGNADAGSYYVGLYYYSESYFITLEQC
jgi:subtilase family serine protease